MIKEFLNKEAIITVGFALGFYQAGSMPARIYGKITRMDENYAYIEFDPKNPINKDIAMFNMSGAVIVNKNYIIGVGSLK